MNNTTAKRQFALPVSEKIKVPYTGSCIPARGLFPAFLLLLCILLVQNTLQAQENVFSRDNANTSLWWDDDPAKRPWFYSTSGNQNRPDNFSIRHNVFIGHNNNLTMTTNGAVFQLRTLTLQSTASTARTFDNNAGGINLSVGLTNSAAANHTFNTPFTLGGNVDFSVVTGGTLSFGSAGTIALGANTLNFTGEGNYAIGGVISGTGAITKSGAGTLTLSAASTHTGGTTVSGGTFTLGGNGFLAAAGGLTVNGGTLNLNGFNQTVGVTSGSGGIISLGAARLTMQTGSGTTLSSKITGSGGITKAFAGTLIIAGANEYTGATQISNNGGILQISADNNLGRFPDLPTPGNIILGGGSGADNADLRAAASFTLHANRGITLNGTTVSRLSVADGHTLEYNGIIAGTGSLSKLQPGTLVLGGANTYGGTTTVVAGVLNIRNGAALGAADNTSTTGTTVNTGFALELEGGITVSNEYLTLQGTGIGGAGALRNISGNNTWGGNVLFNATGGGNIASDAGKLTFGGSFSGGGGSNRLVVFYGNGDIEVNGTLTNTITTVTKGLAAGNGGTGALILNSANSYLNNTTVLTGAIGIGHNSALSTGAVNLGGTGALNPGLFPSGGNRTIANNIVLTSNVSPADPAIISGSHNLTVNGSVTNSGGGRGLSITNTALVTLAGNVFLSENNTQGRTLTILGSGSLDISGAIANNSGANTIASALSYTGSGILTLTGANSYTGLTTVSSGTLRLNRTGGATLPAANSITLSGTGTLRVSTDQTLQNLAVPAGTTLVIDNGATLTITGSFTGGGTIDNKGTLHLQGSAPQTFPGATTTINNGTANQMNNLTIANAGGVTLNREFTVNGSLHLASGALAIGANQTLTVNGGITGSGTLTGSQTSGLSLGGGSGTVSFTTGSFDNYLKTLTLSGNAAYTLGSTLHMVAGTNAGVVTISGTAALNSNGFLVLKSDANGTASLAEVTSTAATPVAGEVTAERFIPQAPATPPQTGRSWRLMALPVTSATTTIRDAWAGGSFTRVNSHSSGIALPDQSSLNGAGTIITGHSYSTAALANAAGYDWWPELWSGSLGASSSIRRYTPNAGPGHWNSTTASRAIISTPLSAADQAYMLFVRGNRTITTAAAGVTDVLLAPKGNLRVGNVTITVPAMGSAKYFAYGNPYASTIDFDKVYTENSSVIKNVIHMWDATLPGVNNVGGYRTIAKIGDDWTDNFLGAVPHVQYLHSGQGVLLESNTAVPATLTTRESHKAGGTAAIAPFSAAAVTAPSMLNVQLKRVVDNHLLTVGGTSAIFGENLKQDATDAYDIAYLESFLGTLGIALRQPDKLLVFEGRPQVKKDDKLWLNTSGLANGMYALEVKARDFFLPGVKAYLVDRYTNTQTELDLSGKPALYAFSGNNDALSKDAARFEIVFDVTPVNEIVLQVNHVRPNNEVQWTVAAEDGMASYRVEYLLNRQPQYRTLATVAAHNRPNATYAFNHRQVPRGAHSYRIAGITKSGATVYSNVVGITTDMPGAAFTIAPGFVSTQTALNLQWENLVEGTYNVTLTDAFGRQIQVTKMAVKSVSGSFVLTIPAGLANRVYKVNLRGKGLNLTQSFVKG